MSCQEIITIYTLNINILCTHKPTVHQLCLLSLWHFSAKPHRSGNWSKLVPGQGAVVRIPKVKAYQYPQAKFHGVGVLVSHRMKSWGRFLGEVWPQLGPQHHQKWLASPRWSLSTIAKPQQAVCVRQEGAVE